MCWRRSSRIRLRSAGSSVCLSSSRRCARALLAQVSRGALRLQQLGELLQGEAEQVAQADDLPHPLDVGLGVAAMFALGSLRRGIEQADLLPVADRAGRGARQLGDLADAQGAVVDGGGARAHVLTTWGV